MPNDPRTWIEISAAALRHNLKQFQRLVGPSVGVMPILKANACGHDVKIIVQALHGQRSWGIGVAQGDEALQLRALGYRGRLIALTSWQASDLPELVRQKIELVIGDWKSLQAVLNYRHRRRIIPRVHIKLDTGTTRIGFVASDIPKLRTYLSQLQPRGVFSHFANAEETSSQRTKTQLLRFTTLVKQLGLSTRVDRHIACSAAIMRYPEAYFSLVRVGIGLYGIWPSRQIQVWSRRNLPDFNPHPVLSWYTRLIQVKTVPAGTQIGYGSTVTVKRRTRIGIIPVGYYDGLDRGLSNRGWVMIRGQRIPIVGRVCMNVTILELGSLAASAGDQVTLIGPGITATQLAETLTTIPYEILSRLNPQIERRAV